MFPRIFTVEEANALIPRLEAVMVRLRGLLAELRRHRDQLEILDVLWQGRAGDPRSPDHEEYRKHRSHWDRAAREIERLVQVEVVDRGVRLPARGLEEGLLDFPTTLDGRWVFLCWRSGEPAIEAWHELDGGFQGRRPLGIAEATRMGAGPHPPAR